MQRVLFVVESEIEGTAIGAAKAAVVAVMPFPKGSASRQLQATSPLIMDSQEYFTKYKTN